MSIRQLSEVTGYQPRDFEKGYETVTRNSHRNLRESYSSDSHHLQRNAPDTKIKEMSIRQHSEVTGYQPRDFEKMVTRNTHQKSIRDSYSSEIISLMNDSDISKTRRHDSSAVSFSSQFGGTSLTGSTQTCIVRPFMSVPQTKGRKHGKVSSARRGRPTVSHKTLRKKKSKPSKRYASKWKNTKKRKKGVKKLQKHLRQACNELENLCPDIALVYPAYTTSNTKETILLCLTTEKCHHLPSKYEDFLVIQKSFYPKTTEFHKNEGFINKNYNINSKMFEDIDETIAFHAESLMMNHRNLEAIKMSLFRSSSKDGIVPEPCIVLVCRSKSYIPIGESKFPRRLRHPTSEIFFPTDVREGYFTLGSSLISSPSDYNRELAMGCSIGPENDGLSATLGPFVNINETSELCFLTVRHLFQPLDESDSQLPGLHVVQPANGDCSFSHQGLQNFRRCGTVKVAALNSNIDAALVVIEQTRAPSRGNFVGIRSDDLHETGFSERSFPSYDDGCFRDARLFAGQDYAHDRVIKFGKQTGLRKGALRIRNMAVRLADETGHIQHGSQMQRRVLLRQLQVESFARKIFFERGDSGSAVFSVDRNNKLYCIGMAIGVMSDHTCIVTPIQNILTILGEKLNQTLELKVFLPESMEF